MTDRDDLRAAITTAVFRAMGSRMDWTQAEVADAVFAAITPVLDKQQAEIERLQRALEVAEGVAGHFADQGDEAEAEVLWLTARLDAVRALCDAVDAATDAESEPWDRLRGVIDSGKIRRALDGEADA